MRRRAIIGLVVIALLLSGCETLAYYHQSIEGHFALMRSRTDIGSLLSDPDVDQRLKERLRQVREIRAFASRALGLPDNDSYRSYADVGRDVLVWSLMAAPEFSLEAKTWCYPVIGCAAYRGYFSAAAAREHARNLAEEGFDTAVLPVPAYSTLGWFDDPVPNTVIDWPLSDLAGLIFHELAHQKVYARGDSAFNESYATLVQSVGVERWLRHRRDGTALARWQRRWQTRQAFVGVVVETRERLATIYTRAGSDDDTRRAKAEAISAMSAAIRRLAAPERYRYWIDTDVNNAHLAAVNTYHRWVPALRALLARHGGDLTAFHEACRELANLSAAARTRRLCDLSSC